MLIKLFIISCLSPDSFKKKNYQISLIRKKLYLIRDDFLKVILTLFNSILPLFIFKILNKKIVKKFI